MTSGGSERARILAFMRAVEDACAQRRVPFRWGTALFSDRFSHVYDLNFLRVERGGDGISPPALAAEAERLQAPLGHEHRKLTVDDDALATRLSAGFEALGWSVERLVAMSRRGPPDRAPTRRAREVGCDALRPAREKAIRSEAWAAHDEEGVRQLLDRDRLVAEAVGARFFAVYDAGEVASYCELYSDGRTAQIESVGTVLERRGRGLARAVVTTAADVAGAEGHDLIFLLTADDDWPKHMYRKLGFDPAGHFYDFNRTPG